MFSFLIPVFNEDVTTLVQSIHHYDQASSKPLEIIIIDDASNEEIKKVNRKCMNWEGVHYIELPENIGRSRIRNRLAEMATFPILIFLDCDSLIANLSDFVANYEKVGQTADILYGGTAYAAKKPIHDYLLHWSYGKRIEVQPAERRNQEPYLFFRSNNFAVLKSSFDKIKFDESITDYGFEDNVFAETAKNIGIRLKHIENPVLHTGLNTNDQFLLKTEIGIKNLHSLYQIGKIKEVRLIQTYKKLKRLRLIGLFTPWINPMYTLLKSLIRKYPESLYLLQIWKLIVWLREIKKPA